MYWKTGTSYAYRDARSEGIFGHYILAVWVGNFDGHGNPAFVGRQAAAPLFFRIVKAIRSEQQNFTVPKLIPPLSVEPVEVCAISGQLPTRYCKHKKQTWFSPGVSPIDKCQIHRPVYIETKTGLRACNQRVKNTSEKVYEFWSSMIRVGVMDVRYMLRLKIDNLAGKVINLIDTWVFNPAKQANLL